METRLKQYREGVPLEVVWEKVLRQATAKTCNDVMRKFKTQIKREVSKRYNFPQKEVGDVLKRSKLIWANASTLKSELITQPQRYLTVYRFKPDPKTRPRGTNPAPSIEIIKGRRRVLGQAFLGRNPQARDKWMIWKETRLRTVVPIRTASLANYITAEALAPAYSRFIAETWDKRFPYFIEERIKNHYKPRHEAK